MYPCCGLYTVYCILYTVYCILYCMVDQVREICGRREQKRSQLVLYSYCRSTSNKQQIKWRSTCAPHWLRRRERTSASMSCTSYCTCTGLIFPRVRFEKYLYSLNMGTHQHACSTTGWQPTVPYQQVMYNEYVPGTVPGILVGTVLVQPFGMRNDHLLAWLARFGATDCANNTRSHIICVCWPCCLLGTGYQVLSLSRSTRELCSVVLAQKPVQCHPYLLLP
jgi:hypothetical protein